MFPIKKYLDVHVSRLTGAGRWFGINRAAPGKGSIGLGFAVVAYTLLDSNRTLAHRRLMTERVEPWLSTKESGPLPRAKDEAPLARRAFTASSPSPRRRRDPPAAGRPQ